MCRGTWCVLVLAAAAAAVVWLFSCSDGLCVCATQVGDCAPAQQCTVPMGVTSENVAEKFGVTRWVCAGAGGRECV